MPVKEEGTILIHTENIFPIIKKAVYSDHEIFIRELISNSVDAIKKRKMAAFAGDCVAAEDEKIKISIEAASTDCWKKYVGKDGLSFGIDTFGKSAPYKDIYKHFELDVENIVQKIKKSL